MRGVGSGFLPEIYTFAPASAICNAIPLPTPRAPPVTKAICPLSGFVAFDALFED